MGSDKSYNIRIPFECLLAKERRVTGAQGLPTVTIAPEDVKTAFDPVIEKINNLIDGQINAVKEKEGVSPKVRRRQASSQLPFFSLLTDRIIQYVILVGGFGRCNYLYDRVDERFGMEVEVLQAKGAKP